MLRLKKTINKSGGASASEKTGSEKKKTFRLTEIEPEYVSLVRAGANRQNSFQVVKAEDGEQPEDEETESETHGEEHTSQPNDQGGGDDVNTGKGKNGEDNTDGSTEGSGTDLSSWLDEAGANVNTLSLDHAIQQAMDSHDGDEPAANTQAKQAHEIGEAGAPPVNKVGEEAEDEEDPRDARIAKLESKLKKQALELKSAQARAGRLAKSVGQSSVMVTGEVSVTEKQQPGNDESPTKGAFYSGGDIAAVVASKG